jgi:hypothetical protein
VIFNKTELFPVGFDENQNVQPFVFAKSAGPYKRKLNQNYLEELQNIKYALLKKGGIKKIVKVWERIGRAKEKEQARIGQI